MTASIADRRRDTPALLTLANARLARRPAGARQPTAHDQVAAFTDARALLEPLGLRAPFTPEQLPDLAALTDEVHALATALATRQRPPSISVLNGLAQRAHATRTVQVSPTGQITAPITWTADTAVAELAARITAELDRMDPARLKHCAREACPLLFYDTTRPGTRQWHGESPCGLRERQARFRAAAEGK